MMNDWWRMSEYLQLEYYALGDVSANISRNIWQGPCSLLWSSLSLLEGFVHYFLEVQTLTAVSLCLIVSNDATLTRWGRLFRRHCCLTFITAISIDLVLSSFVTFWRTLLWIAPPPQLLHSLFKSKAQFLVTCITSVLWKPIVVSHYGRYSLLPDC